MQHSWCHGDSICHPNSSDAITKLYGTSTCGCNNNTIFLKDIVSPSTYARYVSLGGGPRLGDACQSGNMAPLLNGLFFAISVSFLPNYRVNYYDYKIIVKWRSGIACQLVCIAGHRLNFSCAPQHRLILRDRLIATRSQDGEDVH